MAWRRFERIVVAAAALIALAAGPGCEGRGRGPEPIPPNPDFQVLRVVVELPEVTTATDECAALFRPVDVPKSLRTMIETEITAAGMKVVGPETGQPDLKVIATVAFRKCVKGMGPYADGDLVFWRTGGVVVLHERDKVQSEYGNANDFLNAVASTLVRSSMQSAELTLFAKHGVESAPNASASASRVSSAEPPVDSGKNGAKEGRRVPKQTPQTCDKFGANYDQEPTPSTLMNLADCEERVGRLLSAWMHWRQLLRLLPQTGDARRENAQRRLEDLVPRLATLTIRVRPRMAADVRILLDAFPLAETSVGRAVLMGPGDHMIGVEAGGRLVRTYPVSLREGEKRELVVEIEDAAPAGAASAAAPAASASAGAVRAMGP